MNTHKFLGGIGLVAALALSACGGGSEGGGTGGTGGGTASGGAAGGAAITSHADSTGQLKFAESTLSGTANQALSVTFENPAPLQHNWVLVQPGQEDAVATAGAANGGNVPSGTAGFIAGTQVLNQNGEETIQVPAQPAGQYPYICTVPGHYQAGMKGTLTIQ
jgi:uncharacterized cupredoxin-like copper-binding protein